jgi:hypothetical protein
MGCQPEQKERFEYFLAGQDHPEIYRAKISIALYETGQ